MKAQYDKYGGRDSRKDEEVIEIYYTVKFWEYWAKVYYENVQPLRKKGHDI